MKHEDPLKAGIALLKKIPLNMLTEDAQALFTKGMEHIEAANQLLEEGLYTIHGEEKAPPETESLEVEDAATTVDDQMEADLEEATKKALEEE